MCKLIVELLSFTLFVGWFNKTFPGFQTSKIAFQTLQQMQLEQKLWRECQLVTRPKLWSSQRHISRYLNYDIPILLSLWWRNVQLMLSTLRQTQ